MTDQTVTMVYTLMFVFLLFLFSKIVKTRMGLGEGQVKFRQRPKTALLVLNLGLLTAMVFIAEGLYLRTVILATIGYFLYVNREPIILSQRGLYFNGRLDRWEDLKKWSYNDDSEELDLIFKVDGRDLERLLPVDPRDKERILEEIKKYKKK